ncbi:MAG: VCBS repeat-containing protein [Chitinophagaceae bacterium]|nr:VCBS repeat-containing protein [Chitinophagaceae bacterium]
MLLIFFAFRILFTWDSPGRSNFEAQTIDTSLSIGYGIALGDIDGDRKPDILVADKKQFVWYRNGDWKKFVMIENLTVSDNVCIAAEDINGDGKVEVAVGAQWNPSETKDEKKSGSVHFLVRPGDPTKTWMAIQLYHEPTIHRMRWVRASGGAYYLVVLPLHGKDNREGMGAAVNMIVFKYPDLLHRSDPAYLINTEMHLTHNLEIVRSEGPAKRLIYIAGKEGIGFIDIDFKRNSKALDLKMRNSQAAGEVRAGRAVDDKDYVAAIEPMHGNKLVVYTADGQNRMVVDSSMNEGHALATADFSGRGDVQVVAGWRRPDKDGKVGIRLYSRKKNSATAWEQQWIDENGMACEDLQVMDLNGDGRLDIIASGRATHNLKIYWNISRSK